MGHEQKIPDLHSLPAMNATQIVDTLLEAEWPPVATWYVQSAGDSVPQNKCYAHRSLDEIVKELHVYYQADFGLGSIPDEAYVDQRLVQIIDALVHGRGDDQHIVKFDAKHCGTTYHPVDITGDGYGYTYEPTASMFDKEVKVQLLPCPIELDKALRVISRVATHREIVKDVVRRLCADGGSLYTANIL